MVKSFIQNEATNNLTKKSNSGKLGYIITTLTQIHFKLFSYMLAMVLRECKDFPMGFSTSIIEKKNHLEKHKKTNFCQSLV